MAAESSPKRRPILARRERAALGALLALYLIAAAGFAAATPYGEAPDEFAHLNYVEYLVRFGTLPDIAKHPYTSESQQPPLYYGLGAVLVLIGRGILDEQPRTAPLTPPVQGNPAFQPPRRSVVALLHPPDQRWLLWPYVLRGLSILLGLGVVLLTYATARVLVPPPAPALAAFIAATFAALIPEANSIRASVSNENLGAFMGAWIMLLLALHLTRPYSRRRVLWLGVAFGLSLLSKLTIGPLLLPILAVLWIRRPPSLRRLGTDLLWTGVVVAVLAAPFYLYRWIVYGDPMASQAWAQMFPPDSPWHLSDLFWFNDPFRSVLWRTFWGDYGWTVIPLPAWLYWAFLGLTLLGIAGGIYTVARRILTPPQVMACAMFVLAVLLLYVTVILFSLRLIAWQGREMYPAFSSLCLLFGFGLAGLALDRAATRPGIAIGPWRRRIGALLVPALALVLFAVNVYSIVWLVAPILNGG